MPYIGLVLNYDEVSTFLQGRTSLNGAVQSNEPIIIPTLEGDMTANVGDWIIKGVNGEFLSL